MNMVIMYPRVLLTVVQLTKKQQHWGFLKNNNETQLQNSKKNNDICRHFVVF